MPIVSKEQPAWGHLQLMSNSIITTTTNVIINTTRFHWTHTEAYHSRNKFKFAREKLTKPNGKFQKYLFCRHGNVDRDWGGSANVVIALATDRIIDLSHFLCQRVTLQRFSDLWITSIKQGTLEVLCMRCYLICFGPSLQKVVHLLAQKINK